MPRRRPDPIDVNIEINELVSLTQVELRLRWVQVLKRPLPLNSQRDFLLGSLAYELQAHTQGPLKSSTHRALALIARNLVRGGAKQTGMGSLRPGTRLLRTWQGETHEVLALEKGFSYLGETYTSLSEIAETITGAHWSGPVFFGLKKPRPKKSRPSSNGGA